MKIYRAAVIGCSQMGGFIEDEVVGSSSHVPHIRQQIAHVETGMGAIGNPQRHRQVRAS